MKLKAFERYQESESIGEVVFKLIRRSWNEHEQGVA